MRHAGYPAALAAFLGGLILGVRAVLVVFVVGWVLAAVGFVSVTIGSPPGDDQRAVLLLLLATYVPAAASVPVLVGSGLRWGLRYRAGLEPPLPSARRISLRLWGAVGTFFLGSIWVYGPAVLLLGVPGGVLVYLALRDSMGQ